MMVEQLAHARDVRRAAAAAALEPRRAGLASQPQRERDGVQLRAALPRARRRRRRALLARRAHRPAADAGAIVAFGSGLFLIAASLNSPLETIAAKYLLLIHLLQNALIADVAPLLVLLGLTPRMRERSAAAALDRLRARWILPIWLVAWYLTHLAPFYNWALRTGWGLNIEHAILIAGGLLFWWPIVSGRLSPPAALALPRRRLRRLVVPRPRVHLLEPAVLLVLRARAAAVGTVADARPEPRRDPHERRADARLPPRDRLVRPAAARRGARARRSPQPGSRFRIHSGGRW